jgi:hypothetical protein
MFRFFLSQILLLVFSSIALSAPLSSQQMRFEPWLKTIEQVMSSEDKIEKLIEEIPSTNARVAAFNLQSLGELYKYFNPEFKTEVKDFAKDLEDSIGQLDYLKTVYKSTKSDKDEKKYQEGKKKLAELLKKDDWTKSGKNSRVEKIRTFLKKQKWPSYEEDKSNLISLLIEQIEKIDQTNFDVTRLEKDHPGEDGNGIHEIRREIRWFLIGARVLNGLVQFKKPASQCAISDYKDLYKTPLAESKYSSLTDNPNEKAPCLIEQCQFLALSQSANIFGEIKDAAEEDTQSREKDQVPDHLLDKALSHYDELNKTQLFRMLSRELNSCLKN